MKCRTRERLEIEVIARLFFFFDFLIWCILNNLLRSTYNVYTSGVRTYVYTYWIFNTCR